MWKRINRLRQEIRAEKKKPPTPSAAPSAPIGNQYPTMNGDTPKYADIDAAINAVYQFAASELDDDDSTGTIDADMELFTINMVNVDHGDIPVGAYQRADADITYDCTESFRRANHFRLMEEIQQYGHPMVVLIHPFLE